MKTRRSSRNRLPSVDLPPLECATPTEVGLRPGRPPSQAGSTRIGRTRPYFGAAQSHISVRATEETQGQLAALTELWGCTAADAVRKAISDALERAAAAHGERGRRGR